MSDEGWKIEPQAERDPDTAASGKPEHAVEEADAMGRTEHAIAEASAMGVREQAKAEEVALGGAEKAEAKADAFDVREQAEVEANLWDGTERAIDVADDFLVGQDRAIDEAEAFHFRGAVQAVAEAGGLGFPEHEAHGAELAKDLPTLEASYASETAEDADTALDEVDLNWGIADICRSKAQEFRMLGYEHVTGEEIWECVSDKYHKTGTPPLHRIVNDILSLKVTQFMNWMTMSIYKEGRF